MAISNKNIGRIFNALASIMELHGESSFKIRSYRNAYQTIRRLDTPLDGLSKEMLKEIPGVGDAIADKILEFIKTGTLRTYQKYADSTPAGVIELLSISGLGPKKIKTLASEIGIESPAQLLQACMENRLVKVKGFGAKSQADILSKVEYFLASKGSYTYAQMESVLNDLLQELEEAAPGIKVEAVGDLGRKNEVVASIDLISDTPIDADIMPIFDMDESDNYLYQEVPITWTCIEDEQEYILETVRSTSSKSFLASIDTMGTPAAIYPMVAQYIPKECREVPLEDTDITTFSENLITQGDLKGLIHCHTTYSDGIHSLPEMVSRSQEMGYSYILITDHSKAAFYANGLNEERLYKQGREIDQLNENLSGIRIFKGLECDILSNGDLDMTPESLDSLDVVIASIHTALSMDKAKATARLIKAVENPRTDMLGHPTGRLLLARTGYEIDHEKVIDACAAHDVAIEINANPKRLDMDWRWIPYARKKGVWISINPDAHSMDGLHDNRYGVIAARKGNLQVENCLNALEVDAFEAWIQRRS